VKRLLIAAILGIASTTAFAQVNALPPTPHILVFGHAQARAIPDKFSISMTASVTDPSTDVARHKVEGHVDSILAALKQAGVPDGETTATSLSIEPDTEYDGKLEKRVYKGVKVERVIGATFYDLAKVKQFLGNTNASEELQISGITTGLRDEQKLREQLRGKAIESSQQKAKAIAASYSASLSGLYSVSDVAPETHYGIQEGAWPHFEYDARTQRLDRIEVTGHRMLNASDGSGLATTQESLQTGYVTFEENIYAVFLIAPAK
jgi:uncharacterized protein YggE